jgi:hypothetical protein
MSKETLQMLLLLKLMEQAKAPPQTPKRPRVEGRRPTPQARRRASPRPRR